MAGLNKEIFNGGTFDFLIGESQTVFTLHRAAVASQSAALASLMSNGMKESGEGSAYLKDIDQDTFARFSCWLYTHLYSVAVPKRPSTPPAALMEKAGAWRTGDVSPNLEYANSVAELPIGDRKSDKILGRPRTASLFFEQIEIRGAFVLVREQDEGYLDASLDHTDVFLSHARLYVFADRYQIPVLKNLTVERLEASLEKFDCYRSRLSDVVTLFEYVYENTPSLSAGQEPLRRAVVRSTARHCVNFVDDKDFYALLTRGGELGADLCCELLRQYREYGGM